MSHFWLLLKFPIHLCTLQLSSVTSHHSKNSTLNKLNKWTVLPSAPFDGKRPNKPFRLLHVTDIPQQLQSLRGTVGQRKGISACHNTRQIPRGTPVLLCSTTGCCGQGQCQQQQASIRGQPKAWLWPETWDLPMLDLDLPVDPWAPTKLFPF